MPALRVQIPQVVTLHEGDGARILHALAGGSSAEDRFAVFIDGPKGEMAIRLARGLLRLPAVAFVAIHDMRVWKGALPGAVFFSDDDAFINRYGFLDAGMAEYEDGGVMAILDQPDTSEP